MTLKETSSYLVSRIRAAGGVAGHVFSREAAMLIHEASAGVPRKINVICDNALLTGFALNQRPVTRQVVQEVCRDFDLALTGTPTALDTTSSPPLATIQPRDGNNVPAASQPPMFENLNKPGRFSFFSRRGR
jgi:general secretion pathway protein A